MNHFEIIGWKMPTLKSACEKALILLNRLSNSQGGLAIEAHCQDLNGVKSVANTAPSDRCACYCWRSIADGTVFMENGFAALRRANLVFEGATVTVNEDLELPPYDWNWCPPDYAVVSLVNLHTAPLKSADKEPSLEIINLLKQFSEETVGDKSEAIKLCTTFKAGGREHAYSLRLPRTKSLLYVEKICSHLSLTNGLGSFEFIGTPEHIDSICQSQRFRYDHFPPNCWNMNYPDDTVYSYGASAYRTPVPNVQQGQLMLVASAIDGLGERVLYRSVVKKYIAWRLSDSTQSPNAQDNYLLISQHKASYAIFMGFDRYEDKDPTVSKFKSFAIPVIEAMGAQLKKVSGPR